jgi:hypothetical protein
MNTITKAGALLGALVTAWTFVMGFTGWYKHPVLLNLFWVVMPIQIALLIWALRKTAAEGRRYGGQLAAGTLISLIGGVFIFFGSLAFTMLVFPNYFGELAAIQEEMLRIAGKSEAEIQRLMEMAARTSTPVIQAAFGLIGTVVTGIVCSAVIGAFTLTKKT